MSHSTAQTPVKDEDPPAEFVRALTAIRAMRPHPDVAIEETPGPRRLAPHSAAFEAVVTHGERELGIGRLVLLHDPDGQEGWDGTFRLVTYLRVELDAEIATDPLLVRVGWSWLTDALSAHAAEYHSLAGTVTRSDSEGFGALADRPAATEMELRASWTPADGHYGTHVEAWCEAFAAAAGRPSLPPGVASLHDHAPR